MKYIATISGKRYEIEVQKLDAYQPLSRGNVAAPAPTPVLASAPVPQAAAPAAAPAPAVVPAPAAAAPAAVPAPSAGGTTVESPMPGKILDVKVSAGQAVKFGQVLITMEAMKMETEIVAPVDGTVGSILVKAGDAVETGTSMVVLN